MAEDLVDNTPGFDAQVTVPEEHRHGFSTSDAARMLAQARHAAQKAKSPEAAPISQEESAQHDEAPPPEPQSAEEADAAPPQEATGDDQGTDPVPPEPPLEPPTSWQGDDTDLWNNLDPATQKSLLKQDQKAKDWVRRQELKTEAANKTLDAERAKLEQARGQYEQALPALIETLQQSIAGDFPDIKTMDDVQNLARTDWARYIAWDASQKKLAAVASEARAAQDRQTNEAQSRYAAFAREQDKLFLERNPEFADQAKASDLQKAAIKTLKTAGWTEDDLNRQWNGQEALLLRDTRLQEIIHKAALYDQARAAVKKGIAKPVPPVQRPGVAALAPGRSVQTQMRSIEAAMNQTASSSQGVKLGAELLAAHREATKRGY
jgi:hypothetical protein